MEVPSRSDADASSTVPERNHRVSGVVASVVGLLCLLALTCVSFRRDAYRPERFEDAEILVQSSEELSASLRQFDEDLHNLDRTNKHRELDGIKAKWPNAFDKFVVIPDPSRMPPPNSFSDLTKNQAATPPTPELTADAGRTSVLTSTYDRCAPNQPFEVDTDYQGSDLVKGGFSLTSALDCCYKCVETPNCRYFTFGTDKNKCWVKDSSSGHESQNYRTSGDLLQYTFPPTDSPTAAPVAAPPPVVSVPNTQAAPVTLTPITVVAPSVVVPPPTVVSPPASTTTYVTHVELKMALQLLTHNLLHYIALRLQGLGDDMQPQLAALKKQLRVYIDNQVQLILSTTMHGSLHNVKGKLLNDLTSQIGSYVSSVSPGASHIHLGIHHGLGSPTSPASSVHIRELPHSLPTYKDQERLRGLRHSAKYMINSAGTSDQSQDPLAKYGAEAMIPTHIIEHKNVKQDDGLNAPDKCDPLAGWNFQMC